MKNGDVKPDMVTYNTVINALGRCGRVKEATVHLHAMKEQGLSPDLVTFGTLIHACAQSARREAALALFAELVRLRCCFFLLWGLFFFFLCVFTCPLFVFLSSCFLFNLRTSLPSSVFSLPSGRA